MSACACCGRGEFMHRPGPVRRRAGFPGLAGDGFPNFLELVAVVSDNLIMPTVDTLNAYRSLIAARMHEDQASGGAYPRYEP